MPIEDDGDRAAFFDADEFGDLVDWTHDGMTTYEVPGIFSRPSSVVDTGAGPGKVIADARFLCAAASLPAGAEGGDTLAFDGVTYHVRAFLPDGTGMVRTMLEKQA